jgi:hypothetical protein
MIQTEPNGNTRRTLASQIDRLDAILDGLGDALHQAMVAAVQPAVATAVREGVQGAFTELVTNPDVLALFRMMGEPNPWPAAMVEKSWTGRTWDWLKTRVQQVVRVCVACLRMARLGVQLAWQLRSRVLAVLVGVMAALAAYRVWPLLSAEAGGLNGRVAASAVPAGPAMRRPVCTPNRW